MFDMEFRVLNKYRYFEQYRLIQPKLKSSSSRRLAEETQSSSEAQIETKQDNPGLWCKWELVLFVLNTAAKLGGLYIFFNLAVSPFVVSVNQKLLMLSVLRCAEKAEKARLMQRSQVGSQGYSLINKVAPINLNESGNDNDLDR